MKKLLLTILITLAFVGCTKEPTEKDKVKEVACNIAKTMGSVMAVEIAAKLECSNLEAINADIVLALEKIKLCEVSEMSASFQMGSLCKVAITTIINSLTAEKFAAWECTGGEGMAIVSEKADLICAKVN